MDTKVLQHSLEVCRLCGVYDYLEIDILKESPHTGPNFRDKVFKCSGVRIKINDKLTTKLCLQCFGEIKRIDLFRSFCAATNNDIRMEIKSRHADDNTSSDEYEDDVDGIEQRPTASMENDFEIQEDRPPDEQDPVASAVEQEDIGERRLCSREKNSSPSTAPRKDEILCILLSDDDESLHSDVQIGNLISNKRRKKNVKVRRRKKIQRESSKVEERNGFTVRCSRGYCTDLFQSKGAMEYHMKTFHKNNKERKLICHLCKKQVRDRLKLQLHMYDVHGGLKTFKCTLRLGGDADESVHPDIQSDSINNEGKKKNVTDADRKNIKRKSTKKDVNRFTVKCRYRSNCHNSFECVEAMEHHVVTLHENKAKKIFNCYLCKLKSKDQMTLQIHMRGVHSGHKPFKCTFPDCSKAYVSKSKLNNHTNVVHPLTQRKRFNCSMCRKSFLNRYPCNRHMAYVHGKGIQYWCYLCKRFFYDKPRLQIHFRVQHMGQSSHKCPVTNCGLLACSKGDLKRHINAVHTRQNSYNCPKCSFKSFYRQMLLHHMAGVHQLKHVNE